MNDEGHATGERAHRPLITALDVRACNPPLAVPHATASGVVAAFPMVLLDLRTDAGITGSAYVFTYTPLALAPVARLLAELSALVVGQRCEPLALDALLRRRLRLLGAHGFTAMAMAAIDMAAWDVCAKAAELPLHALLGAAPRGTPGYAAVGMSGVDGARREAAAGLATGLRGLKAKIGYPTVAEDVAVLQTLRELAGPAVALMCDYNQAFDVNEAMRRAAVLDAAEGLDLTWIEEPTIAEDYAGHARIRESARTPIQAGENWWGPLEFAKAIAAGATDCLMPDAMKCGGVTGWLQIAALGQAHGLPVSNHLFSEISAHLLAATATAHWHEWCDWSAPVLARPAQLRDGAVWPDERPGIGIEWDEAAVRRFELR